MSIDNSDEMENLKIEIKRLQSQNLELVQARADAEKAKAIVEPRTPNFFERLSVLESNRLKFWDNCEIIREAHFLIAQDCK